MSNTSQMTWGRHPLDILSSPGATFPSSRNQIPRYGIQGESTRKGRDPMGFAEQRFTVNLSVLFAELPLLERPSAAAAAGFTAVELWWPWADSPTPERSETDALRRAVHDAG